jgi:hypothetical protein
VPDRDADADDQDAGVQEVDDPGARRHSLSPTLASREG